MKLLDKVLGKRINIKEILIVAAVFGLAFLASVLMLQSLGDEVKAKRAIAVAMMLVFFASSRWTFWGIVAPLALITTVYSLIGREYGVPSYQYLASLFATNASEATEFLSLISWKTWGLTLLLPVVVSVFYRLFLRSGMRPCRNKTLVLATVLWLIVVAKPTEFVDHVREALRDTRQDQLLLAEQGENGWMLGGVKSVKNQYKNYVLVLGESARRDYFHVYGYPVENTPFLQSVNGTVVEGLTAAGTNTVASLRLMLTQGDPLKRVPNYSRTVVGLAQAGGYATYWFSNQGAAGPFDTPVAAIAMQAEKQLFLKTGGYEQGRSTDDLLLLPLRKALRDGEKRPRFIVLHTMGSHPDICSRVAHWPAKTKTDARHQIIACYSDSIAQADHFLQEVRDRLLAHEKKTGESFSMIYISDHGLSLSEWDGRLSMDNRSAGKYHCDIPLVRINSDDRVHRQVKSTKSGFYFTDGIGRWLGLTGSDLSGYDLFDGVSDSTCKTLVPNGRDDPAIDIRPYITTSEN